jgi:membrane-bound acyltransferase YfiQ involved in biofilm formation
MVVAGWPALFCLGYFFTLRYTSLLAWNLTVWGGVVVFALGIGYALITLAATTHVLPKKGTTA